MLKRLHDFKDMAAMLVEWVRIFPHIFTRHDRASIMERLLSIGASDSRVLDEMAAYARLVLDMQERAETQDEPNDITEQTMGASSPPWTLDDEDDLPRVTVSAVRHSSHAPTPKTIDALND